jgi:hypothetical protein
VTSAFAQDRRESRHGVDDGCDGTDLLIWTLVGVLTFTLAVLAGTVLVRHALLDQDPFASGHVQNTTGVAGRRAQAQRVPTGSAISDPAVSDALRASDADRAYVADALSAHLAAGRLTISEFDDRVRDAYSARALGELRQLLADLPTFTAR